MLVITKDFDLKKLKEFGFERDTICSNDIYVKEIKICKNYCESITVYAEDRQIQVERN